MKCQEALDWLYGTQLFGIKLGLDNIRSLLASLSLEQPTAPVLHVAGTNGKGSVCAMTAAMLRAASVRTGLFTSPHLVRFNERIRIDGAPVPDEAIAAGLTHIRDLVAGWDPHPTFFEITTALALRIFHDSGVEAIVLETGMGGRFDATNAVPSSVSVITRIDLDHAQWLGPDLATIAGEKAGIIRPGIPVITLPQAPEAAGVIAQTALEQGAPLTVIDHPLPPRATSLPGSHQLWNAALAIAALEASGLPFEPAGLRCVDWPGRFQRLGPFILDGAHNPAATSRLVQTWREEFGGVQPHIVLGLVADKDATAIVRELIPLASGFTVIPPNNPRALPAAELAGVLQKNGATSIVSGIPLTEVLRNCPDPTLITGSLFLVGEALALLEKAPPPRVSTQ